MRHGTVRLLWTASLLLLSAAALAQGAPPPDGDREAAKAWANTAKERFDAGDWQGAIDGIREAEKHARAPTLTRLSAQAHERLGKLLTAQRLYRSIVEQELAKDAPEAWVKAQEGARKELESITARIPRLEITVAGADLAGVEVRIDGAALDAALIGRPVPQDPGVHTIEVRAPGRDVLTRRVELRERVTERFHFQLPARTPAEAAPTTTPVAPAPAPTTGVRVPPALTWTALGLGGAGLVAGAVMGGIVLAESSELGGSCVRGNTKCATGSKPGIEQLQLLADLSTAGFVVGGVGVAAGAVLLLLPGPKPAKMRPAKVGVAVSPSSLTVWGAF